MHGTLYEASKMKGRHSLDDDSISLSLSSTLSFEVNFPRNPSVPSTDVHIFVIGWLSLFLY